MTNPWLAALSGLVVTAIFLGVLFGISEGLSFVVPFIIGRSRAEWKRLRVEYFWLIGAIFAPITFAYFALASWALHFTASQIGFNFHNIWLSLGVALPISIGLGSVSGFAATLNARRGVTPMHGVPFGRSLPEVVGMIGYMVLLVGPIEEIPFRGIIQTLLDKDMPQSFLTIKLGTIVAALVFVAYHYRNV
ncbi:MAG TPA: CPBP family glutamic-type intramembrane protease, partial [Ktedonobacterales bacterium]|nr:CPBP family glutamic-type intramembrane protease [Ktedonobacterales bacterium]